ncbi:hypothetical protein NPIL_427091 [Nephila pilipes]|uniref:Uncharacterized protein n=1 Tax=Nephila pilipes TaxID=299642 RepID=A0A8X6UGB0_NEPPI|nr:hypothetical protein NPIL_427091 [Nephila pilipes]
MFAIPIIDQELFIAVEQGNLSEIEKCLNRGANILARDSHHTVIHSAVRSDNEEVVKLVLNKIEGTQGFYIDAKDTEGDTPLMWTAECSYVNAARVLLDYGANVEAKNYNGMTALHWAAKNNRIEVLKLLIDKGANVNVQDNNGETPSDYARDGRHGEIAGYLVFSAAEVFREQGNYNKAWQSYQEAFDIQEVVLGPNHLDTLRTRHNMARVLSDQVKYREAFNIYQEVFDIQKFVLGPDHPDTLMTRHNMAVVLREKGKYGEALNIYREIFNIQKRRGADHPDTFMTRYNMAVLLSNQGKYREALRILRKVLNILEAKLGSDHPVTLLTSSSIEIIQSENESSTSSENHQEVQESEEYFGDELEAAKKGIIEHLKCTSDYLFLVRGKKDRGKNGWLYVLIDPGKKEVFLEKSKTDSEVAADYGIILCSGWGESPPQNIKDEVEGFFFKKAFNNLFIMKEERENKNVYYYVMFQEQSKTSSALVRKSEDYGRILYSGWGQDPPESIFNRIVRECFCTNERDLKEKIANLSVRDSKALHAAARNGELKTLRDVLRKGFYINDTDGNGWTSLHHAAYGGNLEVVEYLIDSSDNLHVKDTVCGRKPVHIAAREGHINVVELFLNRGVKVSDADENGWIPLHYAAWNGHLETVKLLINKGADIHAKDSTHGKKPIHIAAERGYTNVVELFLGSGMSVDDTDKEGRSSLYYAARNGHFEVVKILADRDANIHAVTIHGTKPIHVAALDGHKNVIEFLLDRGANVNDSNKDNWTPLHFAAEDGQLRVAKFLVKKGANISTKTSSGHTPLDIARANGHSEGVDILEGLNTEGESFTYTSLHAAAKDGDLEAVKHLTCMGAGINDHNEDGWTPLHYAVDSDELEVVKLHIDKSADVHAETKDGKKPIDLARGRNCFDRVKDRNHSSIAELLRKKMEEVEKETNKRQSENESSTSSENHQEVQESEEYFDDELEAAKKRLIEIIRCTKDYLSRLKGKDRGKNGSLCVN